MSDKTAVLREAGGIGDVVMTMAALQGLAARNNADLSYYCLDEYRWVLDAALLGGRVRFVRVTHSERRGRDEPPDPVRRPYLARGGGTDTKWIDLFCPAWTEEKRAVYAGELPASRVESFCKTAGVRVSQPHLVARPAWKRWAEGWLDAHNPSTWRGGLVAVQPFATTARRSWRVEGWAHLIAALKKKMNLSVVTLHSCLGPRPHRSEPRLSELGGWPMAAQPIPRVLGLLSHASVVVSVDSAVLHLSAALGKPTIGVFGPTSGEATCAPYSTASSVECKDAPCEACYLMSHKFAKTCMNDPAKPCSRYADDAAVLKAIQKKLG